MVPATECRLELLIGRRVVDADGEVVGRLEEVVAELDGEEYVVREFHVGAFAILERLGGGRLGRGLLRLVGGNRLYDGYVVPWKLMDLSDPECPRVTVSKGELPRLDERSGRGSAVRRRGTRSGDRPPLGIGARRCPTSSAAPILLSPRRP